MSSCQLHSARLSPASPYLLLKSVSTGSTQYTSTHPSVHIHTILYTYCTHTTLNLVIKSYSMFFICNKKSASELKALFSILPNWTIPFFQKMLLNLQEGRTLKSDIPHYALYRTIWFMMRIYCRLQSHTVTQSYYKEFQPDIVTFVCLTFITNSVWYYSLHCFGSDWYKNWKILSILWSFT